MWASQFCLKHHKKKSLTYLAIHIYTKVKVLRKVLKYALYQFFCIHIFDKVMFMNPIVIASEFPF